MCKVDGCWDKHEKHNCRLCGDQDSDHFTTKCPKGIILYHATQVKFVSSILKNGLKPSDTGRMGPGIYFTTIEYAKPIAKHISKNRAQNSGIAIFKAIVLADKVKTGLHPSWAGIKHHFPEFCLQTKDHIIIGVYLMDGQITEQIEAPMSKLVMSNKFTINGKINVKKIITCSAHVLQTLQNL